MEKALGSESRADDPRFKRSLRRYLPGLSGIAAVIVLGSLWAFINFGSVYYAFKYLSGKRIIVEPQTFTVEAGKVGDVRNAIFVVKNLTNKRINIIGVTRNCTCINSSDIIPLAIPAKGATRLNITLGLVGSPSGLTDQTLVYHTDDPEASSLTARVIGRAIKP